MKKIILLSFIFASCQTASDTESILTKNSLKHYKELDSINNFYLMVDKKTHEGLTNEEAIEFSKKVMQKNNSIYYDSIYFDL